MTCLEKITYPNTFKMTDSLSIALSSLQKSILTWFAGDIWEYKVLKKLWPSFLFYSCDVTFFYIFYQTFNCILSHDEVEGNIGICQGQQDLDNDPEGAGSPAVLTLKSTKHNNTAYHQDLLDKNNFNQRPPILRRRPLLPFYLLIVYVLPTSSATS